jgi:hypothetical protein
MQSVALIAALLAAVCAPSLGSTTLDTCEGAFAKLLAINCDICRCEQNADGNAEHTPASCGHAECAELISSIDDDALAKMKTGFQVCA